MDAGASAQIEGLTGAQLRAVASLWKRSARELCARFGGSSMQPTIAPGDELRLRCVDTAALGDIVVFVHADQVVVHRVVGLSRSRRWILTRGDAHALPDQPLLDPEALIGRVVRIRRGEVWLDPPPAPDSWTRRVALAICLTAARIHLVLGRRVIRALRLALRLAETTGPHRSE